MEPRSSGHNQTGFMTHQAPQQGTWSMKEVATNPAVSVQSGFAPSMQPAQGTPIQADDGDLIEREWVEAAKKVMTENKDDPYNQCKALTMLKLQYIKKRYGEDIKVPE